MLALGQLGDTEPTSFYATWACANCANLPDPDENAQCQNECGTQSTTGPTQVVSSLPSGTSVSSIPGGLMPSAGTTPALAINWWRVGLAMILGLAVGGFVQHHYAHRRA